MVEGGREGGREGGGGRIFPMLGKICALGSVSVWLPSLHCPLWCFIQKTLVVASHFILKGQSGNPARIERETMSSKTKRKTTKQSKAHISLYKG